MASVEGVWSMLTVILRSKKDVYTYIHTDVHTHNLLSPGQALPLALETYRQRLLQVPASSFPADFPSTKHTC